MRRHASSTLDFVSPSSSLREIRHRSERSQGKSREFGFVRHPIVYVRVDVENEMKSNDKESWN